MLSVGLKGIDPGGTENVEALILETLRALADKGIDRMTVEASLNTVEFRLRENNFGSFPRGIAALLRSLKTWLYDRDPLAPLAFEAPLRSLKTRIAEGERYFENLITHNLLDNPHRTTLTLRPDPEQTGREAAAERQRLDAARAAMNRSDLEALVEATCTLKRLQETPDPPEALATIPTLALEDLPRRNKVIPIEVTRVADTQVLYHDLATNGVLYLDLAFDLHVLPADLLPYVPLFARALLETGAGQQGFVSLSQRIGRTTGGIRPKVWISAILNLQFAAARLFLRAKAVPEKGTELLAILRDVLLEAHLNNQERLNQLVLEEKATKESSLVSGGSHFVDMRIRANFHEADWAEEQIGGISYLWFLRKLADGFEASWPTLRCRDGADPLTARHPRGNALQRHDRRRELAPLQARADFLPGCVAIVSGRAVFLADWRRTQFRGPDYSGKRELCGQRCQPLPFGLDAERCGPRRRQISPHDLAVGYGPRSGRRVWWLLRA